MIKTIFNILLTCLLINFSFYYTNIVSNYLKDKDPIMIKIKNLENKYEQPPVNATILNHTIIPGVNGKKINRIKSYYQMKKINSFLETLLVFDEIKPDISLSNYYHYYIVNGNKNKKNISLLLEVSDLFIIDKIEKELQNEEFSFILNSSFLKNNQDDLKKIKRNIMINHKEIENNNLIDYCYTNDISEINECENYKIYTIAPKFITNDYYYQTYINLENGGIYSYHITNDKNINDLKFLITGLRSLGFNIVSIDELIKE